MWISTAVTFSKPCLSQSESEITKSCPTLCNGMDCSLPGSSVHGIFQARSPTRKMTAASNTEIWQGSTFVVSEVSGGRSQTTEALGLSSGTWHSKWQLRKASFTKAPSAPLKRVGKCRSAATLWTHLITATLKPLLQGKECSEGLGAVHDTRTQEIGWGRYPKENCNRFEFSDANIKRETWHKPFTIKQGSQTTTGNIKQRLRALWRASLVAQW